MKKYIYIILGALTLSLTGCKDFLVEENLASNTADAYYRTTAGHEASLAVTYSWLHDVYRNQSAPFFLAGTDLHILSNARGHASEGLAQYFNLGAGHGEVGTIYNNLYKGIGAANTTLHYADLVEDYPNKALVLAESRFMRAYYYMILVQNFGGTPFVVEMNEEPIYELPRPTDVEVWDFVITEMEAAMPGLMARATGDDYGHVDKRACNHFLALAYLNRGWKTNAQADFTKSRQYADAAIGGMPLIDDYSLAYATGRNGRDMKWRNDEVIFSMNNHASARQNPTNNYGLGDYFGGYFNGPPQESKQHTGAYAPTQYFMWLQTKDIEDPNNDVRWDATFEMVVFNTTFAPHEKTDEELKNDTDVLGVWIPWWKPEYERWETREDFAVDYPGTLKTYTGHPAGTGGAGGRGFSVRGEDGSYLSGRFRHMPDAGIDFNTATQAELNEANDLILIDVGPEQLAGRTPYGNVEDVNYFYTNCVKFDHYPNQKRSASSSATYQRDLDLARLAETYLIAAEAAFKAGNAADAAEYINVVRRRSIDADDAKREMTADMVSIERILDERARELFGMFIRWADLSRTGELVNHAVRYNPDLDGEVSYFNGTGGQKLLRPIPQAALDNNLSENQQNPGY